MYILRMCCVYSEGVFQCAVFLFAYLYMQACLLFPLVFFLTVFLILWFWGLLSSFVLLLRLWRFFFSSLYLLEWLATSAPLRMATTLFVFFLFEGCFHFSVSLSCCFRASFHTYLYGCISVSVCSFWQQPHIACDDKRYGKPPTV